MISQLVQKVLPEAQHLNIIHPASRGVAAHTAGLFRSVRGAKGGVEYEEQSSTGELTYITAGFVNIFLSGLKICFLPQCFQLGLPKLSNFHFPSS